MNDLRTSLILNLTGNLPGQSRKFARNVENIGRRGARAISLMNRGLSAAGRGIDRLGNRYTGFIFGAGGIATLRMVGNLEERFTRLGIQAGRSADEMDALKRKIFDVSRAPDIRIDPSQLTGAVEEIVEKTGDLKFAEENLRGLAAAIQATGAQGMDIGGIAAEFQKMGIRDVMEPLDILAVQGKEGAFTLQELSSLGSRVVTAYTAMGRTGVPAIREMGAALQVIRQGTGDSAMAATAFEAVIRTLGNADKIKLLRKGGIQVFEPEALKQGKQILRPINELMVEIVKRAGGKKTILSKVFDEEAIRAFNAAASEFQRIGNVESLDHYYNVQADGTTVFADSARAAKDFNAALTNLYTAYRSFADKELSGPVEKLADTLNSLDADTVDRWMSVAKWIGVAGGVAIGGRFLQKTIFGNRGIVDMFRRPGEGGTGGTGIPGMPSGVVPVYVVNKHMSLLNDGKTFTTAAAGAGGATTGAAATGGAGGVGMAAAAATPAIAAAALAATSAYLGKKIGEKQIGMASNESLREMLDRTNVVGGGGRSELARMIRDEIDRRDVAELKRQLAKQPRTDYTAKVGITVKSDVPVVVDDLYASPGFEAEVDTGQTMGGQR